MPTKQARWSARRARRCCLLDSGVDQNAVELGAAAASSSPAYSPMKQTRRSARRARRGFCSLPVRTPARCGWIARQVRLMTWRSTRVSGDSPPWLPRISQIRRSPFACSSRPGQRKGKGGKVRKKVHIYIRSGSWDSVDTGRIRSRNWEVVSLSSDAVAISSDARAHYKEFGLWY